MEIRKMDENDLMAVAGLEKECFSAPWSEQSLSMELHNPCAIFWVAEEWGKILGYIGMHAVLDEGYLANVAVGSPYRRKGVATALLDRILQYSTDKKLGFLTLEVRESNYPAISFYEKNGFGIVGRRKHYYSAPEEDALLMTHFFGGIQEAVS